MSVEDILDKAKNHCLAKKERFTLPRQEVLKIIASRSKPMGAYDILNELGNVLDQPKPPTAYRAIEFWQQQGFIHRIESLNAYVLCRAGHRHTGAQFLICDDCGLVIETHICEMPQPLQQSAKKNAFTPSSWNIEIRGRCDDCEI